MKEFFEISKKLKSFGMQYYRDYYESSEVTGIIFRCLQTTNLNSDDYDVRFYLAKHNGDLFELFVERNGDEYLEAISIDSINADFIAPYAS